MLGVAAPVGAYQQITGKHLFGHNHLSALLELDDVFHRDDHLVDVFLHVQRHDASFEVLFHLVLITGLSMNNEPATGPIVGTVHDRALGENFFLVEDLTGLDIDVGRGID